MPPVADAETLALSWAQALNGFEEAASAALREPSWYLREDNYEPALEHELESRFAVANGFIGIRGSLDLATEASRPRTYVAGLFDLRPGPPALSALVPAPQAFPIRLSIDGEQLDIGHGSVIEHTRLLDYRKGTLRSLWRHELRPGLVVSLESLRFTSLATPGLAVQLLTLRFESPVKVSLLLQSVDSGALLSPTDDPGVWRTGNGSLALACLQDVRLRADERPRWRSLPSPEASVECSRHLSILRLASYGIARDSGEAKVQAHEAIQLGKRSDLTGLQERHARLWRQRWEASDVVVDGDEEAQEGLRFAIYHLNSAVNPRSTRVSVAARGLTGDGYMGHVFWDTELFMLPFYTFTWPEAARALLDYRHRTLPAARAKARRLGFQGALYAWESTDTGEEATPPYALGPRGEVIAIRNGDLEQHVNAAVAYAVWQYWQATHDVDFLLRSGAEILLETSRFWASRCELGSDGLQHIRGVIGPDEYHEDIDDNAYTNCMARWNIERGLDTAALLHRRWPERWQELARELDLTDADLDSWRSVASSIYVSQDPRSGVMEQFAGYSGLEFINVSSFAGRSAPMDVLIGPERTRRSQVIKQADVLMLMALLPDAFPWEAQGQNFDYYEPRCGHGSSLSPPIHSLVASRLGLMELAQRYFKETAAIDLNDSMGNSAAGLHLGALGGLWQAAVLGFGGMALREGGLAFDPHLPAIWRRLRFPVQWRGRRLIVDLSKTHRLLEVTLERGRPMTIYVGGSTYRLERDRRVAVPLLLQEEA